MEIKLNSIQVAPAAFVAAARVYEGARVEDVGRCTGLLLHVLRDVGLLEEFDLARLLNLSEVGQVPVLWRLLEGSARRVGLCQKPGDLFFGAWQDVDARRTDAHHLNIWMGLGNTFWGSQMQALMPRHGGTGRVSEVPLSALDLKRVMRVYRLEALCQE